MKQVIIAGQTVSKIEYKGQPVITFRMIDELHQRPEGTARKAFNNHQNKFIENEDYFRVPYEEWSQIIAVNNIHGDNKQRNPIVFLTQSGYLMLVKYFNDDLAWKVQRELVKHYFISKEQIAYRKKKQLSEADARIKASRLYQNVISEGQKSGLSKQDAVLRAWSVTLQHTGYDLMDAIPEAFRSSEICLSSANHLSYEMFVTAWWSEFGDKRVTSKDLFPLIEKKTIPLEISAKTERGVITRFGNLIKRLKDKRFRIRTNTISFNVTIRKAGTRHKALIWQLRSDIELN